MAITNTARVLLFKELSTHQNYWRNGRLDELLTELMIEEMYIKCILEYNADFFLKDHHAWHVMPGELTSCPGVQTMEPPYSFLDHASPWRLDELNNPKAKFPEAYTIFESLNDRASATEDESKCQCLLGILEVKREQLDLARKAGCNEITNGAKISSRRRS